MPLGTSSALERKIPLQVVGLGVVRERRKSMDCGKSMKDGDVSIVHGTLVAMQVSKALRAWIDTDVLGYICRIVAFVMVWQLIY